MQLHKKSPITKDSVAQAAYDAASKRGMVQATEGFNPGELDVVLNQLHDKGHAL